MNYKFSLSTISTVIEWLAKFVDVESQETPKQFLKENVCSQKLFVEKNLENEIFTDVCRHRDFIKFLLNSSGMQENSQLTVHLHLLIFFLSKSTSSTILDSIKNHFSNDVIKVLLGLIDDEQFMMLVQRNGDQDLDKNSFLGNVYKIKALRLKLQKSKLELAVVDGIISRKLTKSQTKYSSTIFEKTKNRQKKLCSTNGSGVSENQLELILKNLKQKRTKPRVVSIKNNTASVLRAGSFVSRKLKSNDSIVEKLVAGSNDPLEISLQLKEIVEEAQLNEHQQIERNHLLGRISYEEAKIARIEAIKRNQIVAEDIKKERQKLFQFLKQSHEQKMFNSKQVIRKTHLSRLKAKKNQIDAVMRNKMTAADVKKLNEKLQKQLNDANENEFQRKTELTQKVKLLEEKLKAEKLKKENLDDYHKLSILEHKQSIINLRKQLDLEKETRQKKIQQENERQKQLIVNNETLIQFGRKCHLLRSDRKIKHEVKSSADLTMLREKLAEMRRLTAKP